VSSSSASPIRSTVPTASLRFTGLTQKLGQLFEGAYRDLQSNCWVSLRMLSQPCGFYLSGPPPAAGPSTIRFCAPAGLSGRAHCWCVNGRRLDLARRIQRGRAAVKRGGGGGGGGREGGRGDGERERKRVDGGAGGGGAPRRGRRRGCRQRGAGNAGRRRRPVYEGKLLFITSICFLYSESHIYEMGRDNGESPSSKPATVESKTARSFVPAAKALRAVPGRGRSSHPGAASRTLHGEARMKY
jgi:hypothetical protein